MRTDVSAIDGPVKNPISALRVSFVTAAYGKYASFLKDSQALISGFLQSRLGCDFLDVDKAFHDSENHLKPDL